MSRSEEDSRATQDGCFEVAAAWHAKWQSASGLGLSAEEVDEWVRWSQDPENKRAYDAVEFVARAKYALKPPPMPSREELAADSSDEVVFLPQEAARPQLGAGRFAWRSGTYWRRAAAVVTAAAAVVAAITFTPVLQWLSFDSTEPVHVISTTSGEVKHIVLRDGSRVTLGAKTELSVNYGRCQRTIPLNSGEALFTVAHDPRCPFIVIAGGGAITALGTEFSVRRTLDRVTVQVAEGIVNVQPRDTLVSVPWPRDPDIPHVAWSDAKLTQGQEVTYAGSQKRSAVASEDPNVATAWLDGRRVYRHEPLAYLVADISRYFDEPIEVDHDVGELQFTGLVYESQVKKFLSDLEIIFPVTVAHTPDHHIVIHSRDAADGETAEVPTPDIQE
jgi:transmembrane sensor